MLSYEVLEYHITAKKNYTGKKFKNWAKRDEYKVAGFFVFLYIWMRGYLRVG